MEIAAPHSYLEFPEPIIRPTPKHGPFENNGEAQLAQILTALKYPYEYETRFYQFEYFDPECNEMVRLGFCPDFYLPESPLWPALNIELTFANPYNSTSSEHRREASAGCLKTKRLKVRLTREKYGIETILIDHWLFRKVCRNPNYLRTRIHRATEAHAERVLAQYAQLAHAA